MRMTDRDRKVYKFLLETGLPATTRQLSKLFYNQSSNLASSLVIAQRRLKLLCENDYIKKMNRKFGEQTVYYCNDNKPNLKQLNHKLMGVEFLSMMAVNGFEILKVEAEKSFLNGELRCDLFIKAKYNRDEFYIILECDLTKSFNEAGYSELIESIQKGQTRFDKKVLIVSICDKPIQSDIKRYVIQLKRDLSDFSKVQYQFVK